MVKAFIVYGLEIIIIIGIITQIILPMFIPNLRLFWLFKKKPTVEMDKKSIDNLSDEVDEVIKKRDETKEKVDDVFKTAEELKNKF